MKFLIISLIVVWCVLCIFIVPWVQFVVAKRKNRKHKRHNMNSQYLFSRQLLDYKMKLSQNVCDTNCDRFKLADRGWVRCPNGTIMTEDMFDEKKKIEYDILLP